MLIFWFWLFTLFVMIISYGSGDTAIFKILLLRHKREEYS